MILVGIDDTDSLDSRGTNKLARVLAAQIAGEFHCRMIVRHQLLVDERIPFTSHNGSASLWLEPHDGQTNPERLAALFEQLRAGMLADFIDGSDPGLCLTTDMPKAVIEWGLRCQREIVTQVEARDLAELCGVRMVGLGGTEGGVIGALAAIGLAATGDDGRIVQWHDWPDDLSGPTPVEQLQLRDIEVRWLEGSAASLHRPARTDGHELTTGVVEVGKHARPNLRDGRAVLFVVRNETETCSAADWIACKLK